MATTIPESVVLVTKWPVLTMIDFEEKVQQWKSNIPPISRKRTNTTHLKTLNIKTPRHMTLEIQELDRVRHTHVTGLNLLLRSSFLIYACYRPYEYHWLWYCSGHTMYVVISTTVYGLSTLSQICAGSLLFTTARKHYYMYIWMAYQSLYLEDCVFNTTNYHQVIRRRVWRYQRGNQKP
jgi:hypothetical protein